MARTFSVRGAIFFIYVHDRNRSPLLRTILCALIDLEVEPLKVLAAEFFRNAKFGDLVAKSVGDGIIGGIL